MAQYASIAATSHDDVVVREPKQEVMLQRD